MKRMAITTRSGAKRKPAAVVASSPEVVRSTATSCDVVASGRSGGDDGGIAESATTAVAGGTPTKVLSSSAATTTKTKTNTTTTTTTTTTPTAAHSPAPTAGTYPHSKIIDGLFAEAGINRTITKDGWCLKEGMNHVAAALSVHDEGDDGEVETGVSLLPLIQRHGLPRFYSCCKCVGDDDNDDRNNNAKRRGHCRHDQDDGGRRDAGDGTGNNIGGDSNNNNSADDTTTTKTAAPHPEPSWTAPNDAIVRDPRNAFESLCRIVAGQFVSGHAAMAAWRRLLEFARDAAAARRRPTKERAASASADTTTTTTTTPPAILLDPAMILDLASKGNGGDFEKLFQKPVGLSRTKAGTIANLAGHFASGELSDDLLRKAGDDAVRESLSRIKGIGPWSCDMFLMFHLERPDVLPLGDLGVRKGIAGHFGLRGKNKKKRSQGGRSSSADDLPDPKIDAERIRRMFEPYEPYRSLLSYYMWQAADNKNVMEDPKRKTTEESRPSSSPSPSSPEVAPSAIITSTPPPSKRRRTSPRVVTP